MFFRAGKKVFMFGFREAEDKFACGRCLALLPLQKPRDITASCIDASFTCQ